MKQGPLAGFVRCLRFEFAKLPGRRLPLIALLIGALAALLSGYTADPVEGDFSGWIAYARAAGRGLPATAFFLAILGAVSVNEELQSGALRATLLRPVGRGDLLAAKALVLVVLALVSGLLTCLAAALPVWTGSGFGDVLIDAGLDEPYLQFEAAVAKDYAFTLIGVSLLALPAAALSGLLVSTLVRGEGTAVATTATITGLLHAIGSGVDGAETWSFVAVPAWALNRLEEVGKGVTSELDRIEALGPTSPECLTGLVSALILGVASWLVFRFRSYRL